MRTGTERGVVLKRHSGSVVTSGVGGVDLAEYKSGGVRLARGGLSRGSWDGTDTVNQGRSR